jgi:hypothetical protein
MTGDTACTPSIVARSTGHAAPNAATAIFIVVSIPRRRIAIGTIAAAGSVRSRRPRDGTARGGDRIAEHEPEGIANRSATANDTRPRDR